MVDGRSVSVWANDYFPPVLKASVPNLEMHIYGRGGHGVGAHDTIPYASWRERYLDWLRDLGFLNKPGIETKAAADVAAFAKKHNASK